MCVTVLSLSEHSAISLSKNLLNEHHAEFSIKRIRKIAFLVCYSAVTVSTQCHGVSGQWRLRDPRTPAHAAQPGDSIRQSGPV